MLRKILALAAVAMFLIGVGCANGSSPITPDKDSQSMGEFFNSFDLSSQVVAEYTYTDLGGNVLSNGKLGRSDDDLYIIENRGAQFEIDLTPLHLLNVLVTYNNPAGTIPTGPNAGLPYYYIGQTIDYDVNVMSLLWRPIGGPNGFGAYAKLTAEMHYASFNEFGQVVPGALLPGDSTFTWIGVITPGYQVINDTFQIVPGTSPGLDVTTARIEAPVFLGLIDIIFFDGVAGIWDPL